MAKFGIYLSQVIRDYRAMGMNNSHSSVQITYRKADGVYGQKVHAQRRAAQQPVPEKRDLSSIKHENRQAGKLYLIDESNGQPFELHIPLLTHWKGLLIDHRF